MTSHQRSYGYVTILCQGARHRIEITPSGRLILHNHRRWAAERAMQAMRGDPTPRCFLMLVEWREMFDRIITPSAPRLYYAEDMGLDNTLQHALNDAWAIRTARAWRYRAPRTYRRQMARKGQP